MDLRAGVRRDAPRRAGIAACREPLPGRAHAVIVHTHTVNEAGKARLMGALCSNRRRSASRGPLRGSGNVLGNLEDSERMVARDGIEPPTPAFSGPRSTTELPGLSADFVVATLVRGFRLAGQRWAEPQQAPCNNWFSIPTPPIPAKPGRDGGRPARKGSLPQAAAPAVCRGALALPGPPLRHENSSGSQCISCGIASGCSGTAAGMRAPQRRRNACSLYRHQIQAPGWRHRDEKEGASGDSLGSIIFFSKIALTGDRFFLRLGVDFRSARTAPPART
jgi:hypothetical protein